MSLGSVQKSVQQSSISPWGEWKNGKQRIFIYRSAEGNAFSAVVQGETGESVPLDSGHIKWGILDTLQEVFIQKIDQVAREKLAVFIYPSEGRVQEVWIFEATTMAAPQIRQGKEHLKQTIDPKTTLAFYEKALNNFETALKLEQKLKGNVVELEKAISQMQKEMLLLKCNQNSVLYLSEQEEIERFQETIKMYQEQDNLLECFETLLSIEENFSPHHHLMSAMVHEGKGELLSAVEDYLRLSENNPHALACIEKAYSLFEAATKTESKQNADLLLQKDSIRMAFEKCLITLGQTSPQPQAPTCFVCFNVEEKGVGQWLEETLVPDLDGIGVKPIFCFRDLSQGQDLDNFQELARSADLVIITCTPELKAKYEERKKAPVGLAQEIRMIKGRYNDKDKAHTIFPIYLKGSRKEALPTAYFEPIFGSKLAPFSEKAVSVEFNYFSNVFDLLSALRGIGRDQSREARKLFFEAVKKVLRGSFDQGEVEKWRVERKKKLKALRDSITERISTHTQMVNLPLPSKDFTGRVKELADLHQACKHQHRVAVTGLGGVGKTALALQYGNDYKSHYQFIHFMPAGTAQLIIDGLLKLADDLHVPKAEKAEERLQWLKTTLDRFEKEYLLIFDGIDQLEAFQEVEKYLPHRGRCLLLTSRMPEESKIRGFEVIELQLFLVEEAVEYLLKATDSQEEKEAQELAEILGKLPLALTHAAGYIRSRKMTIASYIAQFNRYELEVFKNQYLTLTKEEKTILTTWKISIDAIEQNLGYTLGQEILEFFSFLGQAPIPRSLIDAWFNQVYPNRLGLELGNALRHLCDYSMIIGSGSNSYSVHLLVQQVTRYQMLGEKKQEVFEHVLTTLNHQIQKFKDNDITTWEHTKLYTSHAIFLLEMQDLMANVKLEQQYEFTALLERICLILGNVRQAFEIGKICFKMTEKLLQNKLSLEYVEVIATRFNNFGLSLRALGNPRGALEYHFQALKIWISLFEENHAGVATSYNNIGLDFLDLDKMQEAFDCFNKALEINKTLYSENNPAIVSALNNMGDVMRKLGKAKEALNYHSQAHQIWQQLYGDNHPDVAIALNNIGLDLLALGKAKKALTYHSQALKIQQVFYRENHLDVATSLNNMGLAYYDLEDINKAHEHYSRALNIRQKIFDENHPDIAISFGNIGLALFRLGKQELALEYHKKALKIHQNLYGDFHTTVATTLTNIGLVLSAINQPTEALKSHQQALKIWIKLYGENHPNTATSFSNMGSVLDELGKAQEGLEFYQKALNIRINLYGENHPDVALLYNNIGVLLTGLERFKKDSITWKKHLISDLTFLEKTILLSSQSIGELGAILYIVDLKRT